MTGCLFNCLDKIGSSKHWENNLYKPGFISNPWLNFGCEDRAGRSNRSQEAYLLSVKVETAVFRHVVRKSKQPPLLLSVDKDTGISGLPLWYQGPLCSLIFIVQFFLLCFVTLQSFIIPIITNTAGISFFSQTNYHR